MYSLIWCLSLSTFYCMFATFFGLYQSHTFQINFLSNCGLCFHSLNNFFWGSVVLILKKSKFVYFLFHGSCFWEKSLPNPRSQEFLLFFFLRSLIVLGFTFRTMIHSELTFVYAERNGFKFFFFMILAIQYHL